MMIVCKGLSSKNCANCLPTVAGNGANPKWKLFPTTTPRALNLANHEATRAGKTKGPFPGLNTEHRGPYMVCDPMRLKLLERIAFLASANYQGTQLLCKKSTWKSSRPISYFDPWIRTPCPNNNHPAQTNTERIGPST